MCFNTAAHRQPLDLDADRKHDTIKLADPFHSVLSALAAEI